MSAHAVQPYQPRHNAPRPSGPRHVVQFTRDGQGWYCSLFCGAKLRDADPSYLIESAEAHVFNFAPNSRIELVNAPRVGAA